MERGRLALTREPGETVVLQWGGQEVTIQVVKFTNGGVRLCVDAPKDVVIVRGELLERGPV